MSDNIKWITEPAEGEKSSEANVAVTLPSPPTEFNNHFRNEEQSYQPELSLLETKKPKIETNPAEPIQKPKDDRFVHYDFKPNGDRVKYDDPGPKEPPKSPRAEYEPEVQRTTFLSRPLEGSSDYLPRTLPSTDDVINQFRSHKPIKQASEEPRHEYPNSSKYVVSDVEERALRALEDDIPSRLSSLRINQKTSDESQQKEKSPDSEAEENTRLRSQKVKDDNGFTYYTCRFCGITFNYITTLKSHERTHGVEKPFVCAKCGEAFHYDCELQYHVKSHVDQKGYKCDCGRTFYQYTELLNHTHPDDPQPFYGQAANQPAEEEQTARIKPFSKIPETDFPTPEYAEKGYEPKYQIRQYNEVRTHPYICQYCSKSYPDSRQLAYHMYSHRGERTFNPRASRYLMCRNENSYITPGVWLDR